MRKTHRINEEIHNFIPKMNRKLTVGILMQLDSKTQRENQRTNQKNSTPVSMPSFLILLRLRFGEEQQQFVFLPKTSTPLAFKNQVSNEHR